MLLDLTRETVLRPRQLLAKVLSLRLEMPQRWQIFGLVVLLSTVASHVFLMALDTDGSLGGVMPAPLSTLFLQAIVLLVTALATHLIGKGFGGRGSFSEALLAMSLAQGVMVVFQALQIAALLISVPLAEVLGILSVGLFFWILANFIMELHGFNSLPKVAIGMIATLFGLAAVLGLLLAVIGIQMGVA